VCVNQQLVGLDEREKAVVQLWRSGDISPATMRNYIRWVRHFYAYCMRLSLDDAAELTLVGAWRFARSYVGPRIKGPICASTGRTAKNALHAWAFALGRLGATLPEWSPKQKQVLSPILKEYCEFRRSHRDVAEGTLRLDVQDANTFLTVLRMRGRTVSRMTVSDIDAFVTQQAEHLSRRTVARVCTSLRSFLRFLRSTGRLKRDLASCVMAPRVRIAERPPRALPWADVKRILGSIQLARSPGKRDFAMLLMMALYGLGAAEVLALQLGDMNWQSGVISVRRPKTGVQIDLPLLPPVARALTAYLKSERPPCMHTRRIFVSTMIPYKPLTSGGIRHRIREYACKAGVTAKVIGTHTFRHTHASRQIDAGANVKVVSDILGHRQPSSTSVYVRVALRRLRGVTLPVPK
jgi:integrase/recombinase XerD